MIVVKTKPVPEHCIFVSSGFALKFSIRRSLFLLVHSERKYTVKFLKKKTRTTMQRSRIQEVLKIWQTFFTKKPRIQHKLK